MTELIDVQPPNGGEYVYPSDFDHYTRSNNATCFACVAKVDYPQGHQLNVIAQCASAARRIAALFPRNACEDRIQTGYGGTWVTVFACDKHRHNLDLLREFVSDGAITLERVLTAARATISRGKFNELVGQEAHSIWASNEFHRRHSDWCDAFGCCISELGRIPSPAERTARAERFHEERKWGQADEDWLEAERRIIKKYTIAA